jgi:hypothetical protein
VVAARGIVATRGAIAIALRVVTVRVRVAPRVLEVEAFAASVGVIALRVGP